MRSRPGTEAFLMEYARHKADAVQPAPDTIETLIKGFMASREWEELAATTRRDHEYAFRVIARDWPKLPLHLTQERGMKAKIRKWRNTFLPHTRKADKMFFSLSRLFAYGVAEELIEKNPCREIKKLHDGTRRHIIWTPELIARFRKSAKPHILAVFETALHTGQRQGDLLALKWSDYTGSHLQFPQRKTGTKVSVLLYDRVRAMIEALPRDSVYIFTNSRGLPWTSDGFKTSFGKAQKRAGTRGVTFHDLRGTFITLRRREGSTADQIAAISGHSTAEVIKVLESHYLAPDQAVGDAVILRMERN